MHSMTKVQAVGRGYHSLVHRFSVYQDSISILVSICLIIVH